MESKALNLAPQYFKSTFGDIKNQEKLSRSEGLEVICAGLPRTGTLSLKAALTMLLGGRCYHGFDTLFGSQNDVDFWVRVANNQASDHEIREFFCSRGCTAAADFPAALYHKRLLEVFPNAKVILTSRSPVSWQKSMRESLYLAHLNRRRMPWRWALFAIDWRFFKGLDWLYDIMDSTWLGPVLGSEKEVETFFQDWERKVKETVSKENLLLFTASDGWGPLCQFLGTEVPSASYPRLNNVQQFKTGSTRLRQITCLAGVLLFLIVVGMIALLAVFI